MLLMTKTARLVGTLAILSFGSSAEESELSLELLPTKIRVGWTTPPEHRRSCADNPLLAVGSQLTRSMRGVREGN